MGKGISIRPDQASVPAVEEYVEDMLVRAGVTPKQTNRINIAVDELYSNIVLYSGAKEAEVFCEVTDASVTVSFRDNGTPYDPLKNDDPDITLPAEKRAAGGLGIFMVKKMMSEVTYRADEGWNLTTIVLKRTE